MRTIVSRKDTISEHLEHYDTRTTCVHDTALLIYLYRKCPCSLMLHYYYKEDARPSVSKRYLAAYSHCSMRLAKYSRVTYGKGQ